MAPWLLQISDQIELLYFPRLEDVLKLTEDVYAVQAGSDYALKENAPRKFSKSALRKMYYPRYSTKVIHSLSIVDETIINYELLAALLEKIATNEDEGAILVFMPGKSIEHKSPTSGI